MTTRPAPTMDPRAAQGIALAVAASPVFYIAVAYFMVNNAGDATGPLGGMTETARMALSLGFLFAGFSAFAASFIVRRTLLQRLPAEATVAERFRPFIVALALTEVPACLGLIHAVFTNTLTFSWILWGMTFAGAMLHVPSRRWLTGEERP